MPTTQDRLLDTYTVLRQILGIELGLLGEYEFLAQGIVQTTDYAIAIPHLKPDPKMDFRMKSEDGIEAILEGDSNLVVRSHQGHVVGEPTFKLTLTQHNPVDYNKLNDAIAAVYCIPAIKPLKSPIHRPRIPVDAGIKGLDNSWLPAIAVMHLLGSR